METVLKSSLLNLAATLVSLAAGFAVSILNARLLGPEGSGLAAFALWFAASLSALCDRGLPQTLLRALATEEMQTEGAWKPLVRTGFFLFLRPVFAAALAVAAYALWVWREQGGEEAGFWAAALVLFVLYALFAFSAAVSRGRGHFRETAVSTVTGSALQLPFLVAGAVLFGPAGAVAAMALRFLPQALRLRRHIDPEARREAAFLTPDMRRYARQMWLSDLIDVVVMTRVEIALLGLLLSPVEMGYFAAAAVFAGLVGQFALQLSSPLIVGFATPGVNREALFANALRLTALAVFPLALGGAAIAPHLLPAVFGADFAPAATPAALLLAASALTGVMVVPWAYLAASGGSASLLGIMIACAGATLALLTGAIAAAGLNGAALARIIVEFMTLLLLAAAIRRRGGPRLPFTALAKTALAASACGLAAFTLSESLPGWGGIAAAIAGGVVIYMVALRLLRLVTVEDAAAITQSGSFRRAPPRLRAALESALSALAGNAGKSAP